MAIVRNKKTNDVYEFLGGNEFQNLRTGTKGTVPDDKAKEVFNISVPLTVMVDINPNIKELINRLGLVISK